MTRHGSRLVRWRQRRVETRGHDPAITVDLDDVGIVPAPLTAGPPAVASAEPELPKRSPEIDIHNAIFEPPFVGTRVVSPVWLDEIVGYLDEDALFGAWGSVQEAGEDVRDWRRRLRPTLRNRLTAIGRQELLTPQVAYGYFPVNSDGRDLIVWADAARTQERTRLVFDRQRRAPRLCVADYFKPVGSPDYVALQVVTLGSKISTRLARRHPGEPEAERAALRVLAGALTVALTEYWHRRIRIEWGLQDEDGPTLRLVFGGFYRGYRYPVTPQSRDIVAGLLGANRVGVMVVPDDSLVPEYTAVALIAHHPQAKPL